MLRISKSIANSKEKIVADIDLKLMQFYLG
jgi:hypothetical protein